MSSPGALYRKYRPQTFAEVRDQDHIVSVLEGAVAKGDIPHALLFSGTRGTGKTTMARIFAKALNTSSVDIYEIDAASNRKIEDVRELREAVHTVPYESKYKVYIIDEVHMLTNEAFNALLKTLEEPPAHVVFILATTEQDKLPDTILSRCQTFRFRSPGRAVLAATVKEVATAEGFSLTPDAADTIAIAADGSFRDALGLTQKVMLASKSNEADADTVASVVGAPKTATLLRLIEAFSTKDAEEALKVVAESVSERVDMGLFMRLLLELVRTAILIRHQPTKTESLLEETNPVFYTTLKSIAGTSQSPINSHLLLRLIVAAEQTPRSPIPQLPLELAIIESLTKDTA